MKRRLAEVLGESLAGGAVAGAVIGVAVGDERFTLARGSANLNTGQPFTEDTAWLLGSVGKILTTTLLLRLVERGSVDLDDPVRRHVPEFTLRDPAAADRITVRMLVNHTNGIDTDGLVPSAVRGRDAHRAYVEHLRDLDVLFEPGTCIHYSNPGFVLAGRIIEEQTGLPYEQAIRRELFEPCGMRDATAVQTQAFLRSTAVGAFFDMETMALRATSLFSVPESIGAAGGTPIVTVADMLAFGRMHLNAGLAPNGTRVLEADSVKAMLTPTFDLGIPQAPPVGLGWWLEPIAGTTAAFHGGTSPGGNSAFTLLPEYDAVITSFGTGPANILLQDRLHLAVIEEVTGRTVTPPFGGAPDRPAPGIAGEYGSFQSRVVVEVEADALRLTSHFEPYDDDHRATYEACGVPAGAAPPVTYRGLAPGLYAPEGMEASVFSGVIGRGALLTPLPATAGRPAGLHSGLRFTPRRAH
ncbi:serine hydrolase domain-containing protein [Nonomuraea sp. NPDC050790]|uniref:serine hydrolase domain-containing protein n=1 Tax=Nonomuraea sp. NPDC050790 TaxID=3364371 RepID=UPI0037A8B724